MRPLVAPFVSLFHHPLAWVFLIALQVLTYRADWPTFQGVHLEAWVLALVTLRIHRELTRTRPFRRPEDVAGGVLLRLPLFAVVSMVGGVLGCGGFVLLIYGWIVLSPVMGVVLYAWTIWVAWRGRLPRWRPAAWMVALGTPLLSCMVVLGYLGILAPAAVAHADRGWREAWARYRAAAADPFRMTAILVVATIVWVHVPHPTIATLVAGNYTLAAVAALFAEAD
jgi:hypothetical protein